MKKILKHIELLKRGLSQACPDEYLNGFLTACSSIEEVALKSKKEYVYNVRRIYNSSFEIEKLNGEIQADGWEVVNMKTTNDSGYIVFNIRKEKE